MIHETVTLYMKDNKGVVREWAISAIDQLITISHGQWGGALQYQTEFIREGKAARSLDEQVRSRIDSRVSKQRDKGYVDDEFEARMVSRPTNTLGLPKPMLASPIKKVRDIDYTDSIVQPKFDGNRCLVYCEDGINKAYTRNGKGIDSITHILNDLVLEEGMILDGELYCHGVPLQTIVSWVKRKQFNTLGLKYHVYDVVAPALPYKARSEIIRGLPIGDSISPVYGDPTSCKEDVFRLFREYRDQGYEGAILRWGTTGYEDGKRSKSLVKIKEWESDEFKVIALHKSRDGWAILECELPNGKTFRVSAPGSMEDKIYILAYPDHYIGKDVTVDFANYTEDGIPFHPVAINFREDIQ